MRSVRWTAAAAAATVWLAAAAGASGQSLTSVRGLGYPLVPVDARSEILGGLGIGLQGFTATMVDPTAAADVARKGGVLMLDVTRRNVSLGGGAGERVGTTRFPLLSLVFPVRGFVLTAGYGGYLDQGWGLVSEGTAELGAESAAYRDRLVSEGGVSTFQVGAAIPLGSRLALGLALGGHAGNQRVTYQRLFDTTSVAALESYSEVSRWRFGGAMARAGVRWDPMDVLRLAASVTWSGPLSADSMAGPATTQRIDLPLQVAMGASGYLAPGLLAAVSGRWSGWSGTGTRSFTPAGAPDLGARDTWEVGGGLEWARPDPRAMRTFPLRLGFRYRQLPFTFVDGAPSEWFVGGGLGMRVGPDPANPLASLDLTVERGRRTAAGDQTIGDLSERMWRVGLSIALFGT